MKLSLSTSLSGFTKSAAPFVGALDAYLVLLTGVWSMVRLLVSGYTGPLVRLRRASDSVEMDFYPLANGRVDVAAILTFRGASSLEVVYVYDQFGSNAFEQSSGAVQPDWAEAVSQFNNAPAMDLGVDRGMESAMSPTLPYSILLTECNSHGAIPGRRTLDSSIGNKYISASRDINGQAYDGGDIAPTLASFGPVCEILSAPNGGNYSLYSDGVNVTSGSIPAVNWGELRLGISGVQTEGARAWLAECVTFNTALDSTQVTAMQAIFNPATL